LAQRAGAARPEEARPLAADAWIDALVARWRATRPQATCRLRIAGALPAPEIVVETTLEQAVVNLLNNAADTGSGEIEAILDWHGEALLFIVRDQGPGFPEPVLTGAAKRPVASATGGAGIGLLLTQAAVERCGGSLHLKNLPAGGAEARIVLPLGRITRKS
jgi:two-component system sensor histidine kinase RegB